MIQTRLGKAQPEKMRDAAGLPRVEAEHLRAKTRKGSVHQPLHDSRHDHHPMYASRRNEPRLADE
jgi:hypothetical protein